MSEDTAGLDFIRARIRRDLASGRTGGRVVTRFPPEPNGYLHVGHAKAICLSFGVAQEFGGVCHLRFDDTNPVPEDPAFVAGIQEDIRWLGFDWREHLYHASDYFDQLYHYAHQLIRKGLAYVCELSPTELSEYRGPWNAPGRESPWRDRPAEESHDLFERMRAGEFEPGERTLRAKIDMASSNMNLRDPVLYRIQRTPHHQTGTEWPIYPTYDFAHPLSDSIEGITHSLCTLEFEDHRPLYDWLCEKLEVHHPQQIEFARLNVTHMLMSKRKLAQLVDEGVVSGWDDPRMPTLRGLRRRGYTPESLRDLCQRVGIAKRDGAVEMALLEHCLREDLNRRARRAMAVLRPLRLVIENYPEDREEELEAINNPEDASMGTRPVPFSREVYIEREDFLEDPPRKFFRLAPGREVRLRYAYLVTCTDVVKDADGEVVELRCTYDPASRGGDAPDGRKVRGTLHWVSARHAARAEVRLYGNLFRDEAPDARSDVHDALDPASLEVLEDCAIEPALAGAAPGDRFQFERQGYFCVDPDATPQRPVFNRTVSLRDTWARWRASPAARSPSLGPGVAVCWRGSSVEPPCLEEQAMPANPPEGMPRLIPYLFYNDLSAALDWLAQAFGLEPRMSMPGPDGEIMHAEMQLADAVIMMGPASDERGSRSPSSLPGVNQSLYVYVDDVDAHYQRAKAAGALIVSEPEDMFWGDRMYYAQDVEGHHWNFAEHVKEVAPEDMKPPGV